MNELCAAMDLPQSYYVDRAAFRALRSPSGIGASVIEFAVDRGEHEWSCVVSDGAAYRYVSVRSAELMPGERLPPVMVEEAVERFAADLPERHRLYHLVNTNPIHLTREGVAHD